MAFGDDEGRRALGSGGNRCSQTAWPILHFAETSRGAGLQDLQILFSAIALLESASHDVG
jgi:hypothetical protein